MALIHIDAILNAIAHFKNAISSPHSIVTIVVAYLAVVVVTLKVLHFMRDRNTN